MPGFVSDTQHFNVTFPFEFLFYEILSIPTVLSIRGMDLEVVGSRTRHIPSERWHGHSHLSMEKSCLGIPYRICSWHKASKLRHLLEEYTVRYPGMMLLHLLGADFSWPNILYR